jgi:hypothetical protein
MKSLSIAFFVFLPYILHAQVLQKFEFLPRQEIVPLLTADATAHRMGVTSIDLSRRISVSLGNVLPVADFMVENQMFRIGVAGSIHAELAPDDKASLITTDFFVDYLLVDIPLIEDWILRMGVGHSSHHLSDNWFERLGKTSSLVYSRDYWQLFVVRKILLPNLFLYGGATYTYAFIINNEISRPWMIQCGGEQEFSSFLEHTMVLYGAVDVKVRQEASFATIQSYQVGMKFQNDTYRTVRLAYQFRNGVDERG